MGVVHKLTEEVVDFIIKTKQDNPSISCRKLVKTVQEVFDLNLSKSSVNNILKREHLSSPVGRRLGGVSGPRAQKTKRFSLPVSAKKKLFSESTGPDDADSIEERAPSAQKSKEQRAGPAAKDVLKSPAKSRLPEPAVPPARTEAGGGEIYDGAGAIFLKAAEWECAQQPIAGHLLKSHLKGQGLIDINGAGSLLMLMPVFGISTIAEVDRYRKHGLWAMAGLKERVDAAALEQVIEDLRDVRSLALQCSIDLPQIFSTVEYYNLHLEDGSTLCLDAQLTAVWPGTDGPHIPLFTSLNQALSVATGVFVNSMRPATLCTAAPSADLPREWWQFIEAFNETPGKRIEKVSLHESRHTGPIAEFEVQSGIKRHFIAGIWPWQQLFKELMSNQKAVAEGSIKEAVGFVGTELYYRETEFELKGPSLRAIAVSCRRGERPFLVLLCNVNNSQLSAANIVKTFMNRWPHGPKGVNLEVVQKVRDPMIQHGFAEMESRSPFFDSILNDYTATTYNLFGLVQSITKLLNIYCQRRFFPITYGDLDLSSMIADIYSISGSVEKTDTAVVVKLLPDHNCLYKKDLEFASKRINESDIYDFNGRKLYIYY